MTIRFHCRSHEYVQQHAYVHTPIDIRFYGSISTRDVEASIQQINDIVTQNDTWGFEMIDTVFDESMCESTIVSALSLGKADRIKLSNVDLRDGIWDTYLQSNAIENVRSLIMNDITDSVMYEGTFWNTIINGISRLRLEKIDVRLITGSRYWPDVIVQMVSRMDKSLLRMVKLEIAGMRQSNILSLCETFRKSTVLESLFFDIDDAESLDFMNFVLLSCPSLEIVSIFSRVFVNRDPSIDTERLCDSILMHPNIKHFVGGFSGKMMRYFNHMFFVKEQIQAFRGRHIKRISSKSPIFRLFAEVDRMVFQYLAA